MGEKHDNPQAFPLGTADGYVIQAGMTLRDYFAGQALAGFLADSSQRLIAEALEEDENFHLIQDARAKLSVVNNELASGVYALADAMLAARNA